MTMINLAGNYVEAIYNSLKDFTEHNIPEGFSAILTTQIFDGSEMVITEIYPITEEIIKIMGIDGSGKKMGIILNCNDCKISMKPVQMVNSNIQSKMPEIKWGFKVTEHN